MNPLPPEEGEGRVRGEARAFYRSWRPVSPSALCLAPLALHPHPTLSLLQEGEGLALEADVDA